MKVSKWNAVLLFCNLLLLAAVACFHLIPRGRNELQFRATDRHAISGDAPSAVQAPSASTAAGDTVTNQFRWRQLESEDYKTYIARLRSIGCPEQTIRDIVIADLDKLLAPKLQSIQGRRADLQFWHSEEEELANERDAREISRLQQAIDQEKRAVIEELLGIDLVRERMKLKGEQDYYERRLGFLPEERRSEVRKILERYDELEHGIRGKEWDDGEPRLAEDRAELRRLREQRHAEIAALLSPAEREQYELWMSDSANAVRYACYGMDISREEFLAIYDLQKEFDARWGSALSGSTDESTLRNWQVARQQFEAELARQLGPERFAEYKRGQDPEFHQLSATAARFKLDKDTAKRVYDVKRAIEDVYQSVMANSALTPEQRHAALTTMQSESERTVRQLLGEQAFRYYLRRGDASWLRMAQ